MERLTRGYLSGNYSAIEQKCDCVKSGELGFYKAINKLGQLEDVEEKHNIDLLKALSILDNGIWIIYEDEKIINRKPKLRFTDNSYWFEYDYYIYKPEHYGKTWAFTKEELENEQIRQQK